MTKICFQTSQRNWLKGLPFITDWKLIRYTSCRLGCFTKYIHDLCEMYVWKVTDQFTLSYVTKIQAFCSVLLKECLISYLTFQWQVISAKCSVQHKWVRVIAVVIYVFCDFHHHEYCVITRWYLIIPSFSVSLAPPFFCLTLIERKVQLQRGFMSSAAYFVYCHSQSKELSVQVKPCYSLFVSVKRFQSYAHSLKFLNCFFFKRRL